MSIVTPICQSCGGRHYPLHLNASVLTPSKRKDFCSRCCGNDNNLCAGNGYRLCMPCYEWAMEQELEVVKSQLACDRCGGTECNFDVNGFDHFYDPDLHICECCMGELLDVIDTAKFCPFCKSDKPYLLDEKSFIFQCPDCGKQSQVEGGKLIGRSEPIKPL